MVEPEPPPEGMEMCRSRICIECRRAYGRVHADYCARCSIPKHHHGETVSRMEQMGLFEDGGES